MVRLFVTGGTIDKQFIEPTENEFADTHIPKMFDIALATGGIEIEVLMLIDSFDMTTLDRQVILSACVKSKEDKIIITHGTDTMRKTAKLIDFNHNMHGILKDKVIVLTGAMKPFVTHSSDALFNLGMAIGVVHSMPPGVYIAINGVVGPWEKVKKCNGKFVLV